jgi:enediyne polyketide synthase
MSVAPPIAIVGMACRYPDAKSPQELWENVLAQRKAFRRIPPERLSLGDYYNPDSNIPDSIYSTQAAVMEGYEFDRQAFKVVGSTFRACDLAHWLALDIASSALADAGFTHGEGLPHYTTGVLLGNTLTGEFSRANTLRLRWPYIQRVVEKQLQGMTSQERQLFLEELEAKFKEPFAPIGEESLAGNLSNTIAGRICNHFDLKGGGYVVDGACSSSLLAVANACNALILGDLDVAIAGGVDLSLDPFELVGFAKAGALAPGEMRVYDQRAAGFIPGEGCGFMVLMRYDDALAQNKRVYGVIRGWGISSDGQGGITRPEVAGQLLAIQRAYQKAGFGVETIGYFEGHGTGTKVGDTTELKALSLARREGLKSQEKAVISSIKANIGHTKAAAGIAGLIKATMAVHTQIMPPMTGCTMPHEQLQAENAPLKVLQQGQLWPENIPLKAAVSAMGFGGINTHIVVEGLGNIRRHNLTPKEIQLISSTQDAELFLFAARDQQDLNQQVKHLLTLTPQLSQAEITDLAAQLSQQLDPNLPLRSAIVANGSQDLTQKLESLLQPQFKTTDNVYVGESQSNPRLGFLFPGQAAPTYLEGGIWSRRFSEINSLYQSANLLGGKDLKSTDIAQPAIITASLAGLKILESLGLSADVAIGHSLGELCALHWAKVYDENTLIELAKIRGKAMANLNNQKGMMASIAANEEQVKSLLNGRVVVIAGLNSPLQTVISGADLGVSEVMEKAQAQGFKTMSLPVSHAFHSPLVAEAIEPLRQYLDQQTLYPLQKTVFSTVTGSQLEPDQDVRSLLCQQITSTVQFISAITQASQNLDLWIEVGPGQILSRLVQEFINVPVVALDVGGTSFQGLLQALGFAFVLGAPIDYKRLFGDRFTRPFSLDWQPQFLANPCEKREPATETRERVIKAQKQELETTEVLKNPLEYVRQLVAVKTELPPESIKDEHRLLGDLHLNSITVAQLVSEAARGLGLSPPVSPTDYAGTTVLGMAEALENLSALGDSQPTEEIPPGVASWVHTFTVEWVEETLEVSNQELKVGGNWMVIADDDYPGKPTLEKACQEWPGFGVVICLKPNLDESQIELLLAGAKRVINDSSPEKSLVLVQHGSGGSGFARTFYLENPAVTTCVVDLPYQHSEALNWITTEVQNAKGYVEVSYHPEGIRRVPRLMIPPTPLNKGDLWKPDVRKIDYNLNPVDVLLVTGGGKGIAAESALSLAKETGVRLALIGRSLPETDTELAQNLARMQQAGVEVTYLSADVTQTEALKNAISEIETKLGPITAILHGAGINTPKLIQALDKKDFICTLAPKVEGLKNLLSLINPEALKYLITFGSIIAETGLAGEADYALANEWLGHLVGQFQADYPHCRCLNLEWSVWSGVGMGERLGRIDTLLHQGITPIPPDLGMQILQQLMAQSLPTTSVIVAGRFGNPPTLKLPQPELPFLRFLENPKVYYAGIELVVEAELSPENDPYLNDHVYQGERIFPGVMGLEAIAQVGMALLETSEIPIFAEVKFNRPVVVSENVPLKIRIAALVEDSGKVKVVLRSEQTAFSVDHFEATLSPSKAETPNPSPINKGEKRRIDPQTDLYGELLFHQGRFQRIQGYYHLQATECLAEIQTDTVTPWFSRYLPQNLILGDAGARDAVIHALQACVPHATILPTGIERLTIYSVNSEGNQYVLAQERQQIGDTFIYDLQVLTESGEVLEEWLGLTLQVIQHRDPDLPWVASLLPTYLERRIK